MRKTPADLQTAGIKQLNVLKQSDIETLLRIKWQYDLRGAVLSLLKQNRDTKFIGTIDTTGSMFMYDDDHRRLFLSELANIQNPMTILEYSYTVTAHRDVDPLTIRLSNEMGGGDSGFAEALEYGNESNVLIVFTDQDGYESSSALPIKQPIIWVTVQANNTSVKVHLEPFNSELIVLEK